MWEFALYLQNICYFYFDIFEGLQNVQSQIKGRSVAACYMTMGFGNGAVYKEQEIPVTALT